MRSGLRQGYNLFTMSERGLRLAPNQWESMLQHVERCFPEEGCGLLAGRDGSILRVHIIENCLHSPFRFRMEPKAQLEAFQQIEAEGLVLLAIFHSHPHGPEGPSLADLEEHAYADVIHIIWSRSGNRWSCKAFRLDSGRPEAIPLTMDAEGQSPGSDRAEGGIGT